MAETQTLRELADRLRQAQPLESPDVAVLIAKRIEAITSRQVAAQLEAESHLSRVADEVASKTAAAEATWSKLQRDLEASTAALDRTAQEFVEKRTWLERASRDWESIQRIANDQQQLAHQLEATRRDLQPMIEMAQRQQEMATQLSELRSFLAANADRAAAAELSFRRRLAYDLLLKANDLHSTAEHEEQAAATPEIAEESL
jgi:hypothetical protein